MTCSIENILSSAYCVYNWMGYLSKASDNSHLIAESSLKYPFVECLERHSINEIHLEFTHPIFKNRKIDAFIGDVDEKGNMVRNASKIFIEFKFVRGDTNTKKEQQRYFDDLMRLSLLKKGFPESKCFFLVCGEKATYHNSFMYNSAKTKDKKIEESRTGKPRNKKKSIYHNWLSFDKKKREKEADLQKEDNTGFVASFIENYLSKKEVCEENISGRTMLHTKLMLALPSNDNMDNSYTLGLWEII